MAGANVYQGYSKYTAITLSDTVNFDGTTGAGQSSGQQTQCCDAIYVGGAGNLVVVSQSGTTTTFTAAVAGSILPIRAIRVNSSSTTASALVALYVQP